MKIYLHDQAGDTVTHRYSVQTEEGGVLFLFDPVGMSARDIMDKFCWQTGYQWTNRKQFPAPDKGQPQGQSLGPAPVPSTAAAPQIPEPAKEPWEPWPNSYNPNNTTQLG